MFRNATIWISILALTLASVCIAGPAVAQSDDGETLVPLELDVWQWLSRGLAAVWHAVQGEPDEATADESADEGAADDQLQPDDEPPIDEIGPGMVPIG